MDIYLDVLVIVNIYITWLLLSLTSALSHTRSKPLQRTMASFTGGFSALLMLLRLEGILSVAVKALSCVVIVVIAFYKQRIEKYIALCGVFFGISLVLSAMMSKLQRLFGANLIYTSGGFIYLNISAVSLIFTTAVIYAAITLFSRLFQNDLGKLGSYRIEFSLGGVSYSLEGVADTGNTARDLFSGLPVIICTGIELEGGLPRAVPYKTISGDGILYAKSPENLRVIDEKGKASEVKALVASIESNDRKRAIFDPRILT